MFIFGPILGTMTVLCNAFLALGVVGWMWNADSMRMVAFSGVDVDKDLTFGRLAQVV